MTAAESGALRERLMALAHKWAPLCTHVDDVGEKKEYLDAYIESALEEVLAECARMAIEDAAKVAAAHRAKQTKRGAFTNDETWQTILDEERGEKIAAHEISVKVRALAEGIE